MLLHLSGGKQGGTHSKQGPVLLVLPVDLPRLLALFDGPAPAAEDTEPPQKRRCRVAVARDEAFCFAYAETLETLEALGAELVFFSPLRDASLPEGVGGLYLPGGYPELYAKRLSENAAIRAASR